MTDAKPIVLQAIWLVVVILLSVYLSFNLRTVTDLKQFMPLEQEGSTFHAFQSKILSGRESSSLLISIHGAKAGELVRLSQGLRANLSGMNNILTLHNGEARYIKTDLERLEESRFLLVDTDWSVTGLRKAFEARVSDLRQGQGPVIGQLIKSDPYLSLKSYFQQIDYPEKLDNQYPVWYASEVGAILRAEFRSDNVPLDTIEKTQDVLHNTFQELSPAEGAKLDIAGPGAIAVATKDEIKTVTQKLSWVVPVLLILVFWIAYRSLYLVWFSCIPLLSGVLAGLVITQIVFSHVHGIVIAFGFTMLGVALDYPVHLFSHKYSNETLSATINRIWPVLRLGGISSAAAFLVLLFSGFEGLSQLAVYASSGLIVALLMTRYFLPVTINPNRIQPILITFNKYIPSISAALIIIVVMVAISVPWIKADTYWNNDPDSVSPVSQEQKEQDAILRNYIGGVEVSDVFMLEGDNLNQLLVSTEQLTLLLNNLVKSGTVKDVLPVTDFLPSRERQEFRKAQIPERDELKQRVEQAVENTPLKPSAFKQFIELAESSKHKDVVNYEDILGTPAEPLVRYGLIPSQDGWLSVIRLSGLSSSERLSEWLLNHPEVRQYHVNIKDEVGELLTLYRDKTLSGIYWALSLLVVVIYWYSKSLATTIRIISPVLLGVTGGLSAGLLGGQGLNVFHLMAVFLVLGMGLDYSLFFNHCREKKADFSRSFHAISVSAVTTVTLFLFLAFSAIPVLSAMGSVIVAGIILSFISALLISAINWHNKYFI